MTMDTTRRALAQQLTETVVSSVGSLAANHALPSSTNTPDGPESPTAVDEPDVLDPVSRLLQTGPAKLSVKCGEYVSHGGYRSTGRGLFFVPSASMEDGSQVDPVFICDPVRIVAQSRDEARTSWGIIVAWTDDDGFEHAADIAFDSLQSTGEAVRTLLLSGGLRTDPSRTARTHLVRYLSGVRSDRRLTMTDRCGWHAADYVTASRVFGAQQSVLIFKSRAESNSRLEQRGSLEDWQESIGRYAIGNPLLLLALGAAFAGPLLRPLGQSGGGFHFRGPSSVGKSVLLKAASSVWSVSGSFVKTWRATSNGLEGIATRHNDGLLLLDELGESEPKSALAAVYMLANGVGKVRANRAGEARPAAKWSLLFLSTGEISLADLASSERFAKSDDTMAGQEVRFLDISADTGCHGVYHRLHEFSTGRALSEHLEEACRRIGGRPIESFLKRIVRWQPSDYERLARCLEDQRKILVGDIADGQIGRAARRVALASIGAQVAAELGVAPWSPTEAFDSSRVLFSAWLRDRGGTKPLEDMQAARRVRDYILSNLGRFQEASSKYSIDQRAGFLIRSEGQGHVYALQPKAFSDALRGLNSTTAAKALHKMGYGEGPDTNGKFGHSKFLGGHQVRVYLINESIMGAE